jgi:hypothetical protein
VNRRSVCASANQIVFCFADSVAVGNPLALCIAQITYVGWPAESVEGSLILFIQLRVGRLVSLRDFVKLAVVDGLVLAEGR